MHAGRRIRIAHRVSAAALAVFLAAHLLNHVVALWGVTAPLAFMEGARLVDRSPALEPMLLAAVLVQIVTGVEASFAHMLAKDVELIADGGARPMRPSSRSAAATRSCVSSLVSARRVRSAA